MNSERIELTQGKFALVDAEDYERLSKYKWHCHHGYAVRNEKQPNGKRKTLPMHRQILETPLPFVDHINLDRLDNRKSNLRGCSASENQANRGAVRNGYKGVYRIHKSNGWAAQIRVKGKLHYLGHHPSEEMAALAYNKAALQFFGPFARLNNL